LKGLGFNLNGVTGIQTGGDLRWSSLIKGVTFGASYLMSPKDAAGSIKKSPLPLSPGTIHGDDNTIAYYASYKTGGLTVDGEYRREKITGSTSITVRPTMVINSPFSVDECGWYASAAYRISKRLELGTYRSWFYPTWVGDHDAPSSHITDQVVTARVDLAKFWDIKIEGHFMNGYGNPQSIRGFYFQDNPTGFQANTKMLVIRTGWNF
jgi:hypothetical protein